MKSNYYPKNISSGSVSIFLSPTGTYSLSYAFSHNDAYPYRSALTYNKHFMSPAAVINRLNRHLEGCPELFNIIILDRSKENASNEFTFEPVDRIAKEILYKLNHPYNLFVLTNRKEFFESNQVLFSQLKLKKPVQYISKDAIGIAIDKLSDLSSYINRIQLELSDLTHPLYQSLKKLSVKKEDLKNRGFIDDYKAACIIESKLHAFFDNLKWPTTKGYDKQFAFNVRDAITGEYSKKLEKHRGWSEVLSNLAVGLTCIGTFLLSIPFGTICITAATLKYLKTGCFFSPKTKSKEILDEIRSTTDYFINQSEAIATKIHRG